MAWSFLEFIMVPASALCLQVLHSERETFPPAFRDVNRAHGEQVIGGKASRNVMHTLVQARPGGGSGKKLRGTTGSAVEIVTTG